MVSNKMLPKEKLGNIYNPKMRSLCGACSANASQESGKSESCALEPNSKNATNKTSKTRKCKNTNKKKNSHFLFFGFLFDVLFVVVAVAQGWTSRGRAGHRKRGLDARKNQTTTTKLSQNCPLVRLEQLFLFCVFVIVVSSSFCFLSLFSHHVRP